MKHREASDDKICLLRDLFVVKLIGLDVTSSHYKRLNGNVLIDDYGNIIEVTSLY